VPEPAGVAEHLGYHCEHQRQRQGEPQADDDRVQRARQHDLAHRRACGQAQHVSDIEQFVLRVAHARHRGQHDRLGRGE